MKIEPQGIITKKKIYNTPNYGIPYGLLKLNNDTMVVGSFAYNTTNNLFYDFLFFLNKKMDSIDIRYFPSPIGFAVAGQYILKTINGQILITGQINDTAHTTGDCYIRMIDKQGNMLWTSTFGGPKYDAAYSSIELPDASILTIGWTRSFGFGNNSNRDVLLVKWDSLGNKLWHKTFGSPITEIGVGISATKDGNYLLACGSYDPNTVNISKPWIIKIDTGGNIIWQSKQPNNGNVGSNPWWAKETSKGDIVCAGSWQNPTTKWDEGWIFLLDSIGNLKWERSFPQGNDHAYFRDVIETSDKGFICAGFCFEGASGGQDAWLVKLDSAGCDSAGCAIYTALPPSPLSYGEGPGVRLFPNPTKEIFYIKFPHQFFADTYTVTVTNMQGQVLHHQKYVYNLRQDIPVFANNLCSGMYLVTIKVDDKTYVSKLVIEK
nr:T9SS type A sorting domain-containing protein [Bacteroidota bacterium]